MTDQSLSETPVTTQRSRIDEISTTLLIELADRTNTNVVDLPPLYETIDPDALDRLVTRGVASLEITFDYVDHRITVWGDGRFEFESHDVIDR